jgi:hypothetical protein
MGLVKLNYISSEIFVRNKMIPQDNMALRRKSDQAVFLPALSSFYSFQICKYGKKIQANRIPSSMQNGIAGLNFLDPKDSYFYYPWCLYSAGHAILDVRPEEKEERPAPALAAAQRQPGQGALLGP